MRFDEQKLAEAFRRAREPEALRRLREPPDPVEETRQRRREEGRAQGSWVSHHPNEAKRIAVRRVRVKELWDAGHDVFGIAEELRITEGVVRSDLKALGLGLKAAKDAALAERRAKVKELLDQNWTHKKIAEELGVTESAIQNDAQALGMDRKEAAEYGQVGNTRTEKRAARHARVRELFEEGWAYEPIAKELGVSVSTIQGDVAFMKLSRYSTSLPKGSARAIAKEQRREQVFQLYKIEGMSVPEVAEKIGVHETTVQNDVSALGINRGRNAEARLGKGIVTTIENAFEHMERMAEVILDQDLTDLYLVSAEKQQAWAKSTAKVRKALNRVRNHTQEGN